MWGTRAPIWICVVGTVGQGVGGDVLGRQETTDSDEQTGTWTVTRLERQRAVKQGSNMVRHVVDQSTLELR